MYFSRSFIASALLGFGTATTHMGEMAMGMSTAVAASETVMTSTAMAAAASSTGMAAEGMVTTHVVNVGGANGSLTFSPDNIQASVGDLVQFQFHPKVRIHSPISIQSSDNVNRTTLSSRRHSISLAHPSRT